MVKNISDKFTGYKKYLFAIIIAIVLSLIFYLVLSLAYCIPTSGRIRNNMENSVSYFDSNDYYPQLMDNYNSRLDNWTDSVMLLEAANEDNRNPFEASLNSYFLYGGKTNPVEVLKQEYTNISNDYTNFSYARYWHGYLVILKPLLWLFNYGGIRSFLCSVQLLLFVAIIYHLKNNKELIIPFVTLFLFFNPVSLMLSMQFSWITILLMIVCLLMIKYNKKIEKNNLYPLMFVIIGSLTSFVDLLTFPLVTIGIPLVLYAYFNKAKDIKRLLLDILSFTILWGIGYGITWAMKWILASLLTSNNVIKDALTAITIRTTNVSDEQSFTYFETLYRNLGCSLQIPWFLIVVYCSIKLVISMIKGNKINTKLIIPLIVIGIYPFIWSLIVQNHTYSHCFFVYRIFGISVFAYLVGVLASTNHNKSINK